MRPWCRCSWAHTRCHNLSPPSGCTTCSEQCPTQAAGGIPWTTTSSCCRSATSGLSRSCCLPPTVVLPATCPPATLIPASLHPQLSENATLGPAVKPLPWQQEDRDVAAGTLCDVAGWGVITHAGRKPDLLQYLLLPVMDRATCNLRKYHDGTVTERMMCAESKRNKDSCKVWGGAEQGPRKISASRWAGGAGRGVGGGD